MEKRIYFTDKTLIITQLLPSGESDYTLAESEFSRAKIVKIFEKVNTVEVVVTSIEQFIDRMLSEFKYVMAAGGLVVNERGESLMMYRRGRWDLPKGHVEPYEECDVCALREVEEETGVGNLKIVRHLCNTFHAYSVYGVWELKHTAWFEMRATSDTPLVPQREEGIERVKWCSAAEVEENLRHSFPTISEVFAHKK